MKCVGENRGPCHLSSSVAMASSAVKRAFLGLLLALAVQLGRCQDQDSGRLTEFKNVFGIKLKWERVRFDTLQIGCRVTVSSSDTFGVFFA